MDGEVRVDLHCHTSASYDCKVGPVRLVELARERGLTHVAITDHEAIEGALVAQAAGVDGITVIVGEEVRTTEGDLILLYVKELIPGGLSPEETVRLAREQGCLVGLAHPFDFHRPSIGREAVRLAELKRLAELADYVECHNGRVRDEIANMRATEFAREFALPQVASSDCHTEGEIASCFTALVNAPESAATLQLALANGAALRVQSAYLGSSPRFAERLRAILNSLSR